MNITVIKQIEYTMSVETTLVRIVASDSETNHPCLKNCRLACHCFPRKILKPNTPWKSQIELNSHGDSLVLPSSDNLAKCKNMAVSSHENWWKTKLKSLMDKQLIALCQETIEELKNGVSAINTVHPSILTSTQFIIRFNALHDDLHSHLLSATQQSQKSLSLNETQPELQSLLEEYAFLKEQASILELRYPDLKEDFRKRCNILNNKLKALQLILWPRRHSHRDITFRNLSLRMKAVRKWLRRVGEELRDLMVDDDLSTEKIDEVYSQQKILQREIETRGKEVTQLVKQCASADGATAARAKRLRRAAANIERIWHNVWIRSLETQCYTEQLLQRRDIRQDNAHVIKETTESDLDEGPLTKHRRLTRDHWSVSIMNKRLDKPKIAEPSPIADGDVIQSPELKNVGPNFCRNGPVHVSDKGVMVGTTGIAALKAEYGDDFSKIEIIQDVGYSSESSTHLSGDDGFFPYYSYDSKNLGQNTRIGVTTLSLRDELDNAILVSKILQDCDHQEESYLNDSGFVGAEDQPVSKLQAEGDASVEFDYLETVLDQVCINFKDHTKDEDLDLVLNSVDIEEPTDTYHNRSSFTTSTQEFYKMISVDSDNGEHDPISDKSDQTIEKRCFQLNLHNSKPESETTAVDSRMLHQIESSNSPDFANVCEWRSKSPVLCSTPIRPSSSPTSLKRKRQAPAPPSNFSQSPIGKGSTEYRSSRVTSWLRHRESSWNDPQGSGRYHRDSSPSSPAFDSITSPPLSSLRSNDDDDDSSSCDASGEYTSSSSSSSDECCFSMELSSDDQSKRRTRGRFPKTISDKRSLIRSGNASDEILLPPPPPLSPPLQRHISGGGDPESALVQLIYGSGDFFASRDVVKSGEYASVVRGSSSVGDLRDSVIKSTVKDTLSRTHEQSHTTTLINTLRNRLSSSLPCLLELRSVDHQITHKHDRHNVISKPSTLESSFRLKTFHNNSSSTYCCSDTGKKKRRSRKKSCSSDMLVLSKRFPTSFHCGQRLQSSKISLDDSLSVSFKTRHFSETQAKPVLVGELDNHKTNALLLHEDNGKGCDLEPRSPVLSPESDVVLTQLEVQSTVSDQVWDDYQAFPYLSEAYSEATVDEDAVRKLTEFGDDYISAIGQPNRLDPPDDMHDKSSGDIGKNRSRKQSKSSKSLGLSSSQRHSAHLDSDSDLEDLHNVLEKARKALHIAKAKLKRRQIQCHLTPSEYTDLHATCEAHLNCLRTISESNGLHKTFSDHNLCGINELIQEWEILQRCTVMYEKGQNHMEQKYLKLQDKILSLLLKLSELAAASEIDTTVLSSWNDLRKNITNLQTAESSLREYKKQIVDVNLQVHRFKSDKETDLIEKNSPLKDKIIELYEKWDEIYHQNGLGLTELEELNNKLECFESKAEKLRTLLREDEQRNDNSNCDTIRLTRQDELLQIKYDVQYLETRLKDGELWKYINNTYRDLSDRLLKRDLEKVLVKEAKKSRSSTASRSSTHRNPSVATEDDVDDNFEDATANIEDKTTAKKDAKSDSNRFWRVMRTAIPIQVALVLLYCLACYLEPHCCNELNNLNFSFYPQLKYNDYKPV